MPGGKKRRERLWFRDADVAEAVDAILFVGLLPGWYPPNYDCGACGYATCAEFLHYTKTLRAGSDELEFAGPVCNLRDVDLGIAVGSAAKAAALHFIDCRCQTRAAIAARKLGYIQAEHAVALLLGVGGLALGWQWAGPVVGLIITVAILAVLRQAAREIYRRLMDAVDPALVDQAEQMLRSVPGVLDPGHVRLRWLGHQLRAECEIVIRTDASATEGHQIAVAAEHQLLHALPRMSAALVHADPQAREGTDYHAELATHR